jgi:serine/threonine protein kinase
LSIRGVQRRSLLSAIELSMTIPASLHDLKWYQQSSAIHGDLTIDNVLIDTVGGRPIIIDPSDDNEVRGPILDFARMSQSLDGGYEFLLQSPDLALAPWGNRNNRSLDVLDFTSAKYRELGDWLATYAAERMSPGEVRSLNFHVGLLFGRMLDHRLRIHPESAPAYYALAVEFLGRHLDQHLEVP